MVRDVADDTGPDQYIFCMIETPLGILRASEIAGASPKIAALVMGTSDLTNELHAAHTRDRVPLWTGLQLCVLAARAHGLCALDGVHLNLKDSEEFVEHCKQGRCAPWKLECAWDGNCQP